MREMQKEGLWIPSYILNNPKIKSSERLLLAEIERIQSKEGECSVDNEHFAKFNGVSKNRISKMLSDLEKKGFIKRRFEMTNNRFPYRIITSLLNKK